MHLKHALPLSRPEKWRAALHLCMRDKWDELKAAVDAAKDDATIAGLAREIAQIEKQSGALEGSSWFGFDHRRAAPGNLSGSNMPLAKGPVLVGRGSTVQTLWNMSMKEGCTEEGCAP
eukprot:1157056-Pelagomonas_calceolata.AAC.7